MFAEGEEEVYEFSGFTGLCMGFDTSENRCMRIIDIHRGLCVQIMHLEAERSTEGLWTVVF